METKTPAISRPSIAVSGGAGYLGRCIMDYLLEKGYSPVCLDNYSTGHRFSHPDISCWEVDLANSEALAEVWKKLPPIDGILHFAAKALVGESTQKPAEYFRNNLLCTLNLAELAIRNQIPFIHSSSCAVYGIPEIVPVKEDSHLAPISPYGETKRMSEQMLHQFSLYQGLRVINLRYFNPAGALAGASHGECHTPETHLIPNVFKASLSGTPISLFGNEYQTRDGSCVRDFLHVKDLAQGHLDALTFLMARAAGYCEAINLGSGQGYSVLEIVRASEKIVGKPIPISIQPARKGDPPELVASISKAKALLGWEPRESLESILQSHWTWMQA